MEFLFRKSKNCHGMRKNSENCIGNFALKTVLKIVKFKNRCSQNLTKWWHCNRNSFINDKKPSQKVKISKKSLKVILNCALKIVKIWKLKRTKFIILGEKIEFVLLLFYKWVKIADKVGRTGKNKNHSIEQNNKKKIIIHTKFEHQGLLELSLFIQKQICRPLCAIYFP